MKPNEKKAEKEKMEKNLNKEKQPKPEKVDKKVKAEKQPKPEKVDKKVKAEKLPKPEKAEKHPKPEKVEKKVKVERAPKPAKADRHAGRGEVGSVEVVQVPTGEPAACSFEPRTGHLVLQIPRARDGAAGPHGPRGADGHQGPQGVPGTTGEPGAGIDYSQAPGGKEDFFLFIDRNGRLCYSSQGEVALVNLILTPPPEDEAPLSE